MPSANNLRLLHERYAGLLLILITSSIYFLYFHEIILNINSMMSSITFDTLKNYYTFCYHARHGTSAVHFPGLHYPFGEHVVYTDCQPLLSNLLRILPFTRGYEIGLLHGFIMLSFVVTPLLLRRILLRCGLDSIAASVFALGIGLMSPQYLKMNAGHFGLCYPWMVPGLILLLMRILNKPGIRNILLLGLYNTLVFFIHPYMGFGLCLFTSMVLVFFLRKKLWPVAAAIISGTVFPALFFKVFMLLTDNHPSRPAEVYGVGFMVENIGSIITPTFGFFKDILAPFFPSPTNHYEGHSYIGVAHLLILTVIVFALFTRRRNLLLHDFTIPLLIAGLLMLLMSFGYHMDLLRKLEIKSASLNQFRAMSRFAWFFYYAFTIFLAVAIMRFFTGKKVRTGAFLVFLSLCMVEAHGMFTLEPLSFWQWKNIFNPDQLNDEEKKYVDLLSSGEYQAIIPLPQTHVGSELYERHDEGFSLIPSMIASCHSGVPICGMMASRTSLDETEQVLSVFNPYKKNNTVFKHFDQRSLFIVRNKAPLMPDEDRIWKKTKLLYRGDSVEYGVIEVNSLRNQEIKEPVVINRDSTFFDSRKGILFMQKNNEFAFDPAEHREYENIIHLKPNTLPPGKYVLSFHYHTEGKDLYAYLCSVILAGDRDGSHTWLQEFPIRMLSGFYNDHKVFENYITVEEGKDLQIFLFGHRDTPYHVSNLLIRPENQDVISSDGELINNYSLYAD